MDCIPYDFSSFIESAEKGDNKVLSNILGWDEESSEIESTGMLLALLNGDTDAAVKIAREMTERVAAMYAADEYAKKFKERQVEDDDNGRF